MKPKLKTWVTWSGTLVRNEGNFAIYEVETRTLYDDRRNKVRAFGVGPHNGGEVKTVLLLGETGNGKTLFLNALLNRLFDVGFDDGIRLQLKDYMDTANKRSTESQTEYTSIYNIYHQEGMLHGYNYRIIDTPGFGDTGGRCRDEVNERSLHFCLRDEQWVGHLNSVALVWKASDYRYDERKKEILSKVKDLLAFDLKGIVDVLLTFATSENRDAVRVIEESGLTYREVFPVDNIPIFTSCPANGKLAKLCRFQWEDMEESHNTFLEVLNRRKAVSLRQTAELFLCHAKLEHSNSKMEALRSQEEEMNDAIRSYTEELRLLDGEESRVNWDKVKKMDSCTRELCLDSGQHCHYCKHCDEVCVPVCTKDPGEEGFFGAVSEVANIVAGFGLFSLITGVPIRFTCTQCSHAMIDHSFRHTIQVKDATRNKKIELAKEEQFEEVMRKKKRINNKIVASQTQLEEIKEEFDRTHVVIGHTRRRIHWLKYGN